MDNIPLEKYRNVRPGNFVRHGEDTETFNTPQIAYVDVGYQQQLLKEIAKQLVTDGHEHKLEVWQGIYDDIRKLSVNIDYPIMYKLLSDDLIGPWMEKEFPWEYNNFFKHIEGSTITDPRTFQVLMRIKGELVSIEKLLDDHVKEIQESLDYGKEYSPNVSSKKEQLPTAQSLKVNELDGEPVNDNNNYDLAMSILK